MVDDIIEKFSDIVTKACTRYGNEMHVPHTRMQIKFSADQSGELRLAICKDYAELKEEKLSMIMGVPHIMGVPTAFGKNLIILSVAPHFIKNSLIRLCEENEMALSDINVYAGGDMRIVLYKNIQYIKDISLDKLVAGDMVEDSDDE